MGMPNRRLWPCWHTSGPTHLRPCADPNIRSFFNSGDVNVEFHVREAQKTSLRALCEKRKRYHLFPRVVNGGSSLVSGCWALLGTGS